MHVLLQYQSKSYYIIGQEVYYSIGRFYYIIGQLLQYRAFLLHYRAVITVSGVYYIIGWYKGVQLGPKFRCFKDIDNDDFRDDLLNAPWKHALNCNDVTDAWSIWHSTFREYY